MPSPETHIVAPNWVPALFRPGVIAFKTYWRLFVSIQASALGFVLAYFTLEPVRTASVQFSTIQESGGLAFAIVSNVCSGALIPELLKLKFRPKHIAPLRARDWWHRIGLLAILGTMVFYFYQFQDFLFGAETTAAILLKKILFDQLVFAPFMAVPVITSLFILHEQRYDVKATLPRLNIRTWRERALPLWAMGLTYWPVMLIFIYALPGALQFTLFLFANAAWSLVMLFVASNRWKQA